MVFVFSAVRGCSLRLCIISRNHLCSSSRQFTATAADDFLMMRSFSPQSPSLPVLGGERCCQHHFTKTTKRFSRKLAGTQETKQSDEAAEEDPDEAFVALAILLWLPVRGPRVVCNQIISD